MQWVNKFDLMNVNEHFNGDGEDWGMDASKYSL